MRSSSMKMELSPCYVGIALVNKKIWVVSLMQTARPLMANVKAKDVVAENASGFGTRLSSAGRNA